MKNKNKKTKQSKKKQSKIKIKKNNCLVYPLGIVAKLYY